MKNLYTNLIESILNVIFRVIAVTVMTSLLLAIPLAAQKTVNQTGRVREITYSKQENITTIGDVLIKLRNGIKKKSYPDGLFDLPVPEYSSFYIEKIDPPDQSRYSLILPSRLELKKPFKYTPNLFEIILSNESKRQKEENRIAKNYQTKYNEEKSSLELQIANLKTALEYSQDESETTRQRLSAQIDSLQTVLSRIPKEFNRASIQDEVERLVAIDYALLTPEEAKKIDLRKEGDWATFQELAKRNIISDEQMQSMVLEDQRLEQKVSSTLDSMAQNKAQILKGIQAYRDMFDSHANLHNNDSASLYINKLLSYPKHIEVKDYITCSNYAFKQIKDSKRALKIISDGINYYKNTQELESEIRLLLTYAELEYNSGKIHKAASLITEIEEKIKNLDGVHLQTIWYANSKIGSFCVSIGEIKKGMNLLDICKSTFDNYDIPDSDTYEFLLSYANSLISIGNYTEADEITEDLLIRLEPLRGNIFYNELYADCLCSKASIQSFKGLIENSVENYNLAIRIYTELFGEFSKEEIFPRLALADHLFSVGKFDEAKDALNNIEEIIKSSYDDDEVPIIRINIKRAEFNFNLANFNEAENLYIEQIEKLNKHFDKQPINAIDAYLGLSKIYTERGDYPRALSVLSDCDSLIQVTFPKDGLYRAKTLSGLANVKFATQKYHEAMDLLDRSLAITRDMVGDKSSVYESLSVEMASYKRQLGFYDQADSIMKSIGENRELLPQVIRNMPCNYKTEYINLMADLGRYDDMRLSIDKSLSEAMSIYGENHLITINIMSLLALYYGKTGDIRNAIKTYGRCIELTQQHYAGMDIFVSQFYKALCDLYSMTGDMVNAEIYADKAYELYKAILGSKSVITLQAQLTAGSLNSDKYDYENKINSIDKIANTLDSIGASNSSVKNDILIKKALLLTENGYYSDALSIYVGLLRTNSGSLGDSHPNIIPILTGMAQCHSSLLNFNEASNLYQKAVSIASDVYGVNNTYYSQIVNGFATFKMNNGQYSEALKLTEIAHHINKKTDSKLAQIASLLNLSNIFSGMEDYKRALCYLDSAYNQHLLIYKNENFRTIPIYIQYAQLYHNYQDYDKAIEYYNRAKKLSEGLYSSGDDIILAIYLGKIGTLISSYKTMEALELSNSLLTEFPDLSLESGNYNVKYLSIYRTMAEVYKAMGENLKAIEILKNLYNVISRTTGLEFYATQILYSIADNECAVMDYSSALEDITNAEDMASMFNYQVLLRNIKRGHAEILMFLGRFDEAHDILNDYEADILNNPLDINSSMITICNALNSFYISKQDVTKAKQFHEISKAYYKKNMGEKSPYYISFDLNSIINGDTKLSYKENIHQLNVYLNAIDSVCGSESILSRKLHFQVALFRFRQEGSIEADKNLKECVNNLQDQLKKVPNILADIYLNLADAYQSFGRIDEARTYLKNAREIVESITDNRMDVYNALRLPYAKCLITQGNFVEAESNLNACTGFIRSKYGENSPTLLSSLNSEISLYLNRFERSTSINDSKNAENVIKQIEQILDSSAIKNPIWESQLNYNKGLFYTRHGMTSIANIYFDKYKEFIINHYGHSCPQLISYYNYQASNLVQEVYRTQSLSKLIDVESLLRKSLDISENLFGQDTPMNIDTYQIQATVKMIKFSNNQDTKYLDEAIDLLDRCLTIISNYIGDSPTKYNILASKQQAYLFYGKLDEAEDVLDLQYHLSNKIWGEDSYNTYWIKCGYANIFMLKNEPKKASEIYTTVLDFLFKHDVYEQEKINILYQYSTALCRLEQFDNAQIQLERALKLIENSDNQSQYNVVKNNIQQLMDVIR